MKNRIDDYVLGNMTPEERASMEHARRYDPELDQAIKDVEDSLAPLTLAAGEISPPAGLWNRIEAPIGTAARPGFPEYHACQQPGRKSRTIR